MYPNKEPEGDMPTVQQLWTRIPPVLRACRAALNYPRSRVARELDIHQHTLRDFEEADIRPTNWNPTAGLLTKIMDYYEDLGVSFYSNTTLAFDWELFYRSYYQDRKIKERKRS